MFQLKYLPHREEDEKIVFFLRRHWYVLARSLVIYFVLALIPLALYFMINQEDPYFLDNAAIVAFLNLLAFVYYLYWWLFLYHSFLDYYLDIWIVTNYRVINIEQRGLFNRFVAEHKLYRIQDVVSEQKGIMPTFLDYGEVHIQTAGSEKMVVFEEVPHPHRVARETIKLIENHKKIMAKIIERIDKPLGID